jgi:hypothetical protein
MDRLKYENHPRRRPERKIHHGLCPVKRINHFTYYTWNKPVKLGEMRAQAQFG